MKYDTIALKCNLFYVKYWPADDLNVGQNMLPYIIHTFAL